MAGGGEGQSEGSDREFARTAVEDREKDIAAPHLAAA